MREAKARSRQLQTRFGDRPHCVQRDIDVNVMNWANIALESLLFRRGASRRGTTKIMSALSSATSEGLAVVHETKHRLSGFGFSRFRSVASLRRNAAPTDILRSASTIFAEVLAHSLGLWQAVN